MPWWVLWKVNQWRKAFKGDDTALNIKQGTLIWRVETDVKGEVQSWGYLLTLIYSCVSTLPCFFAPPPLYALRLPLFCHLVNYRENFISMQCTSLAMWFSVDCLRYTTPLSSLSGHLPQSPNSPAVKGKFHIHQY